MNHNGSDNNTDWEWAIDVVSGLRGLQVAKSTLSDQRRLVQGPVVGVGGKWGGWVGLPP